MAWSEYSLTHRLAWFVFKKPARRSSLAFLTTNPSGTMGLRIPWTRGRLSDPPGRPSNAGTRACGLPPNTLASCLRIRVRVLKLRSARWLRRLLPHSVLGRSGCVFVARVFPVYPFVFSGDANVLWPDFCLGRSRSCDRVIFPFISELVDGCGLDLVNPP